LESEHGAAPRAPRSRSVLQSEQNQ
jgi:hypothetical protein